jgi:tRNA pseudouridine55 synthase
MPDARYWKPSFSRKVMAPCGILNLNKPAGISSREAVDRALRYVKPIRCGHAGTLDPLATGVLLICVGAATRLVPYLQRMSKQYRATFLLGRGSPSDDTESLVTPLEGAPTPTPGEILAALPSFRGQIEQRPPAYSAVKLAGRRAYKLARRGLPVEPAPRTVTIHRLELLRYEYPELELDIECSSGTYVRALGRDLAAELGTAAVMSALQRTAIGGFRVEDAVRLDDLTKENLPAHLHPALDALPDLPRISLSDAEFAAIRHGRPIALPASAARAQTAAAPAEWAALDGAGRFAAVLYEKRPGQLWPLRNFM